MAPLTATMGDSLGIYTVHCKSSVDTLRSLPFNVIADEDFYIFVVEGMEDVLNAARVEIPDIALPVVQQKQRTNLDGEKKGTKKVTQTASEASTVLAELKNIFKLLGNLAQKGEDLN